jgi:endonuclease/exonuclease/phosphatase family metal-dependent hydrolase
MTNGLIQLEKDPSQYQADSIDRILMSNANNVTVGVYGVVIDECTRAGSDHCPVFADLFISKYGDHTNKY